MPDNLSAHPSDPSSTAFLLPHPIVSPSTPIAISPLRTTVGRSPRNTIALSSATISRRHAVIICREGRYHVKDMASRNGTFINKERITASELRHHDQIAFGDQSFLFLKQSANKKEQKLDGLQEVTGSITLGGEEIDPSSLYAYATEQARLTLYPTEDPQGLFDADSAGRVARDASSPDRTDQRESEWPDDGPAPTVPAAVSSQAHRRLSLLYRLSERLRSSRNSQSILNEGLELILQAIPEAERTAIMLRTGRDGKLKLATCRYHAVQDQEPRIEISRTLLDWVLSEKIALTTHNALADERLKESHSIRINNNRAIICVPIIYDVKVIGVLYVDSSHPLARLTQDDVAFTAAVAHELALTIVNMQLQQTAIRNERMAAIGLTVSNLAHNIKNLAMMNQNAADLMKIHLERIKDPQIEKCWRIIETGLTRVNTLALEMLDYSRGKALAPAAADINRLIENSTATVVDRTEGKSVSLVLDLAPDLPQWTVDANEFQRALTNLVVNAVDAIGDRPDGEIRIRTFMENNRHLAVAVQDNGCGIDADKQNRIFDLFYTTKGTNGNGLGLPMVKKFVQASGGQLRVESQKGLGTTMKMVFPPG